VFGERHEGDAESMLAAVDDQNRILVALHAKSPQPVTGRNAMPPQPVGGQVSVDGIQAPGIGQALHRLRQ
jgi:hypothetical protein